MKVYKSKIDVWLMALVFVPLVIAIITAITESNFEALLVIIPTSVFVAHVFYKTEYRIYENDLLVKSSFIVNQKIRINDIISIKKTRNPLSAPALSINRLEIKYGSNYDYTLISPKDRQEFIDEIIKVNPSITVKL